MNAIAKSFPGGAAGSTERRQLILLGALGLVLVLLLVWQVPKLLGGSGSSSEAAPAASPAVASAAAPTTAATAPAAAAATSPGAKRAARWIDRQPARDPFVPLTPPAVSAPAAPTPVAPAEPEVVPTAAEIWTNGRRQVVGVKQRFKMGDTTFRLVSVTADSARIDPVVGSLAGGGELTLSRATRRTIESSTGAPYRITFTHPLAAVPSS